MERRVVVSGMGMITPLGHNVETTWHGIVQGHSGIDYISLFDATTFPVKIAGEVKNFLPDKTLIPKPFTPLIERGVLLCLSSARRAVDDAGIDWSREDPQKVGISLGAHEEYLYLKKIKEVFPSNDICKAFQEGQDTHSRLLQQAPFLGKVWPFKKRADIGPKLLSIIYNIQGPVSTSHTACSSSAHAIGKGKRFIENGDCDLVLAGGHCSMVSEFSVAGFYLLGTLSTANDEPQRASRPFDLRRDGFVISEGAGVLILEELAHAQRRGAHIYAELSGYGSSSNAYRITDSPPDGRGGDLSMRRAMQDAHKTIDDVDYINAHGTGTLLNDRSETRSIKNIFGQRAYEIPISSTKSMLGHLVNGSSAVELIVSIMAIKEGIIPPTINLETPDPDCDLDYVPQVAREQGLRCVLSNSFAFGGQNATLIAERFSG